MQVVDVVVAVPELRRDLLPGHEGEISHLKQSLTFHAVDAMYRFSDFLLQLHQVRDASVDLGLKLHYANHSLLHRGSVYRWNLGHL